MIQIKHLTKAFDEHTVFHDLNLVIPDHNITVILGKSGAGKSVLLKLILGLILPDEGEIEIEGVDITALDPTDRRQFRLKFGMVFQHSALLDSLNVGENVGLGLSKLTDQPASEIRQRVTTCLREVNLEDTHHLLPASLSGGMKKRVAFARAISMQPDYLLYDEPTSGLDPISGRVIGDLIKYFARDANKTSVVVTHDMGAALDMADQIALLDEGRIQIVLPPEEFKRSDHIVVKGFLEGLIDDPTVSER